MLRDFEAPVFVEDTVGPALPLDEFGRFIGLVLTEASQPRPVTSTVKAQIKWILGHRAFLAEMRNRLKDEQGRSVADHIAAARSAQMHGPKRDIRYLDGTYSSGAVSGVPDDDKNLMIRKLLLEKIRESYAQAFRAIMNHGRAIGFVPSVGGGLVPIRPETWKDSRVPMRRPRGYTRRHFNDSCRFLFVADILTERKRHGAIAASKPGTRSGAGSLLGLDNELIARVGLQIPDASCRSVNAAAKWIATNCKESIHEGATLESTTDRLRRRKALRDLVRARQS